jgi:CheY-like chemotaxis protein
MKLEEAVVLVVDDEAELRDIFERWLARKGSKVLTAANGADALRVLATQKIDVLISDIRMPVLDGVSLVRRIHEMGLFIPSIVFVSGFGDVEPREMYALGVERLIEKPLSRKDLIRALEESLMEREELWLTPLGEPTERTVALEVESLSDSPGSFQLGRGGCCFVSDAVLVENQTIDLGITLSAEGLSLRASGVVRWYAGDTGCTGMAFRYLDPQCRGWVIQAMKAGGVHSFIPRCAGAGHADAHARDGADYMAAGASIPR